jgi:hypothetical protein
VWLISHQPAVLFSHNKPATSNQPTVLFSHNKSAPTISHQPNERCRPGWARRLSLHVTPSWVQDALAAAAQHTSAAAS